MSQLKQIVKSHLKSVRQVSPDPNSDFKDGTGNLWFTGILTSGHD